MKKLRKTARKKTNDFEVWIPYCNQLIGSRYLGWKKHARESSSIAATNIILRLITGNGQQNNRQGVVV